MSDELPTEDRLRRIERGVQRRIDARRATAQRLVRGITGAAVAVLVIGGGFALLRPMAGTSAGSSGVGAAGSAGGSAASAPATAVPVVCHDGAATTTVRADRSALPVSAFEACAAASFGADAGPSTAGSASGSPTAMPRVLCRAEDGVLHVYVGTTAVCATHGLTPYRR
ncbi:MAG: hypothetical protein HIU86_07750 [Acidobacteria bacterium]|nr:hypothetical protein [Acidobacteriota bacterium]